MHKNLNNFYSVKWWTGLRIVLFCLWTKEWKSNKKEQKNETELKNKKEQSTKKIIVLFKKKKITKTITFFFKYERMKKERCSFLIEQKNYQMFHQSMNALEIKIYIIIFPPPPHFFWDLGPEPALGAATIFVGAGLL